MEIEHFLWIGFVLLILVMIILDLGLWRRQAHEVKTKEALYWTALWIVLAFIWSLFIYYIYEQKWIEGLSSQGLPLDGKNAALQFLTGYLVEESLSLDNVLVMALIFSYFKVPLLYQQRVLTWGILGVLILRLVMIVAGLFLLERLAWVTYVFGAILLYTALKMLMTQEENKHFSDQILVRFIKQYIPLTSDFHQENFFIRLQQKWHATPLFLALVVVEGTDVLFAIDSIPAIFAITKEPFIVFTSNIFAIMGLRSLYFVLAAGLKRFVYLKISLAVLLAFVGIKMLIMHFLAIPTLLSLAIIIFILALGIITSLLATRRST